MKTHKHGEQVVANGGGIIDECAQCAVEPDAFWGIDGDIEIVTCEWFALCANEATSTRPHPILGDVPICDRCNAKMDAIEGVEQ